ncbi:MAG: hypothetical protein H7X94_06125 [Vallitaleaceae bacterium]|nr:hypothetical protein [Vallitaleaceae bacterium]
MGVTDFAANGDTANKIGTSGLAVLAKYYGVKRVQSIKGVPYVYEDHTYWDADKKQTRNG